MEGVRSACDEERLEGKIRLRTINASYVLIIIFVSLEKHGSQASKLHAYVSASGVRSISDTRATSRATLQCTPILRSRWPTLNLSVHPSSPRLTSSLNDNEQERMRHTKSTSREGRRSSVCRVKRAAGRVLPRSPMYVYEARGARKAERRETSGDVRPSGLNRNRDA